MTDDRFNLDATTNNPEVFRKRKRRKVAVKKRVSRLIANLLFDQPTQDRDVATYRPDSVTSWDLFHKHFENINFQKRSNVRIAHKAANPNKILKKRVSSVSQALPDLVALSKQHKVVEELKRRRVSAKMLRRRHREELRNEVAEIYHFAEFLRHSESDWLDFCRDPDWEGFRGRPKPEDQKRPLRFVFRFHVGFSGPSETKKASRFDCALTPLFEKGIKAREIPAILKRSKGIIGLARKHAEEKKAAALVAAADRSVVSLQLRCGDLADPFREIELGKTATLQVRIDANKPALMEMTLLRIVAEN